MGPGQCIVVASPKGGVGKTTLALNLGYAMARRSWRTLIVDADPQGGIALSISAELRDRPGLVELLAGGASIDDALVPTRLAELALLPLGQLPYREIGIWSAALEDGEALSVLLETLRDRFDLIFIDTAPNLLGTSVGALRAADHTVIPLQAEPLAARAVSQLLELIAGLRRDGAGVCLAGLVLSMMQSRNDVSLGVAQESWRLFPDDLVFEASIPRDPIFLEASAAGVPLGLLSRRPPAAAMIFDQLAAELEQRIGLDEKEGDALSLLG